MLLNRLLVLGAAVALAAGTLAAAQMTSQASPPAATDAEAHVPLRLIVVGTEDEARQVLARLERGDSFVELARTLSLDPTAAAGGRLGPQALAGLRPEVREAVAKVAEGRWTPAVRVPTGFAVLLRVSSSDEEGRTGDAVRSPALAASGAVKYVTDIGGYGVSNVILQQFIKPEGWNMDPATVCQVRRESLAASEAGMRAALAAGGQVKPFELVQIYFLVGQMHAYHGRMAEAIAAFQDALEVATDRAPGLVPELLETLGVAHLHKAGLDNHLHHAPGDRCLLAIRDRSPLADPADARQAIGYFTNFLERQRDSLEVRWLLNLAHMAAGTYPDGVPAAHLVPPSRLESAEEVGRFADVAAAAGLSSFASAGGVIVDDFDNDGRFEVVTSSMNSCEPMRLFARGGSDRFVERGEGAGLAGQLGGLSMVQADYDNDGRTDVLLLRGAWELPQRKSLLRNNDDGTFTDVTAASGLAAPATSTQAAVWTDIDRDGFLDLFIGNEAAPAQLFRNRGDGTFEDIAARAGVARTAFSKAVSAADYDNDGWPDLHVSNIGGANFLYRNNRNGTFTEVGDAARVPGGGSGFAGWFFDYDNDGWEDLFVTSFITSVEETARTYLGLPNHTSTLKLYRNERNGRFEDVTRRAGLDKVFMPMGANYGDLDNDGFLDVYMGTGNPSYAALVPSVLLRNRDGASFVDVTASSGTGELHKGHGVAFADLDRDGDQDIVFEVGGATPADRHMLRLFENPGHGNDWLAVTLTGVKTNRNGIGARLAVTVESGGRQRTIHRSVGGGGSFGSSPLEQHIGLGRDARIVALEVWWPTSNTRQRFEGVAVNQVIAVTEFAADYARLTRTRQPLTPR